MTIAAIETRYAGCRFRSRLEARWARFFDELGIAWEYEPQGHLVGPATDRRPYLPDFWLPQQQLWIEVKGSQAAADRRLLSYAVHPDSGLPGTGAEPPVLLLLGEHPYVKPSWWRPVHQATWTIERDAGPLNRFSAGHPVMCGDPTARYGIGCGGLQFTADGSMRSWGPDYWCADVSDTGEVTQVDESPSWWKFDAFTMGDTDLECITSNEATGTKLAGAYCAARSARFEHGERG